MNTITVTEIKNLLSNPKPGVKIIVKTPTQELTMQTRADILQERYAPLLGQEITITDAASKYNIDRRNILRWKDKGYIDVIRPGYKMTVNEAEVAYCVDTYNSQQKKHGTPLFDDNGLPYELKHPELSKKRQNGN